MENICALVEEERFQEAHPLCKELLLRDPNNAAALEIMAIIIIEGGILYDPNVEDQVESGSEVGRTTPRRLSDLV